MSATHQHGVFIGVSVDDSVAGDVELGRKLEEVCPVDIYKGTDAGVTIVEEFVPEAEPPPVDFAALQEEIGRAILEAELREPVPQPIPGKFAGDIA